MARRRRIVTIFVAAILGTAHAPLSHAQFGGIVYDPTNYRQNFLTAIHNHGQLVRQAAQLRNEAQMLINQAKHLSKLDVNAAHELSRILSEIAYLNAQAENVAYEVARTRELVKDHYPDSYESYSEDDFLNRAEAQWLMSQHAYKDAMIMQSKMVETLEDDRDLLGQLMDKSHTSIGELQSSQSTNQLLGLLIKQSMQAQQMQITQARAVSIDAARRIAIEEESRIRFERFVGTDSAYGGGK